MALCKYPRYSQKVNSSSGQDQSLGYRVLLLWFEGHVYLGRTINTAQLWSVTPNMEPSVVPPAFKTQHFLVDLPSTLLPSGPTPPSQPHLPLLSAPMNKFSKCTAHSSSPALWPRNTLSSPSSATRHPMCLHHPARVPSLPWTIG